MRAAIDEYINRSDYYVWEIVGNAIPLADKHGLVLDEKELFLAAMFDGYMDNGF